MENERPSYSEAVRLFSQRSRNKPHRMPRKLDKFPEFLRLPQVTTLGQVDNAHTNRRKNSKNNQRLGVQEGGNLQVSLMPETEREVKREVDLL